MLPATNRSDFCFPLANLGNSLTTYVYPDVPLKLARQRRDEARRKLAEQVDPRAERKAERDAKSNTLRAIGLEWFELQANPSDNSWRAALIPVTAKKDEADVGGLPASRPGRFLDQRNHPCHRGSRW
jgi:hypothetical protein